MSSRNVPMSVRLSPEVRERLIFAAKARKVRPATLAASLIAIGLANDDGPPEDGPSPLRDSVDAVFDAKTVTPQVTALRELATALGAIVDAGGSGASSAARELRELLAIAARMS